MFCYTSCHSSVCRHHCHCHGDDRALEEIKSTIETPPASGRAFPTPFEISSSLEDLCLIDPRKSPGLARMISVFGLNGDLETYSRAVMVHQARFNAAITVDAAGLYYDSGLYWPGLGVSADSPATAWMDDCSRYALPLPSEGIMDKFRREIEACKPHQKGDKVWKNGPRDHRTSAELDGGKLVYNEGVSGDYLACALLPSHDAAIVSSLEVEMKPGKVPPTRMSSEMLTPVRTSAVWTTIWFRSSLDPAYTFPKNRLMCPFIAAFIDSIPGKCGDAFVSILKPGSHIKLHQGSSNVKMTCHLGISGILQPHGQLHIRAGAESRSWKEDTWIIFNDSVPHEVWHNGDQPRCVLIVDVWHADLTQTERWAIGSSLKLAEMENRKSQVSCCCSWMGK